MKLSERIKQNKTNTDEPSTFGTMTTRAADAADAKSATQADPFRDLKRRAQEALLVRMGPALWDSTISVPQLDAQVVRELSAVIKEERIPLNDAERDQLVSEIVDQALGYGPIERYLDDPTVSEVMVNGIEGVYDERNGQLEETDAQFFSEQHVLRVIDRKFTQRVLTLEDLVELGTLTPAVGAFLSAGVLGRIDGDAAAARTALQGVAGVDTVEARGQELTISVADGATAIGPVAIALHDASIKVRDLTLRTPTLDDVFLELTGAHLEGDDERHDQQDQPREDAGEAHS